jgi:hypothetical protein
MTRFLASNLRFAPSTFLFIHLLDSVVNLNPASLVLSILYIINIILVVFVIQPIMNKTSLSVANSDESCYILPSSIQDIVKNPGSTSENTDRHDAPSLYMETLSFYISYMLTSRNLAGVDSMYPYIMYGLLFLVLFVLRLKFGCNSFIQVFLGVIVGVGSGIGSAILVNTLDPSLLPGRVIVNAPAYKASENIKCVIKDPTA